MADEKGNKNDFNSSNNSTNNNPNFNPNNNNSSSFNPNNNNYPNNDDDDEKDTVVDLITSQTILRHHKRLLFPHRNSLQIPEDSTIRTTFGGCPNHNPNSPQLTLHPDQYDRKLRRLSDPGGGGLYAFKGPTETKIHSSSGKICDPRLEMIRSLSPSKVSQVAGEEGEALTPQIIRSRSSRSKSVFQLPWGTAGIVGGAECMPKGSNRNRSMSVSVQSQSPLAEAATPPKTRADSPTPPNFFEAYSPINKPKLTGGISPKLHHPFNISLNLHHSPQSIPQCPNPFFNKPTILNIIPSVVIQDDQLSSIKSTTNPSSNRRRSISLEGNKLDSILEDNKKPSSPSSQSPPPPPSYPPSSTKALSSSSTILSRKFSLPQLKGP